MTDNAPSVSVLQLSDLHVMTEANGNMLGIDTEYYFHRCLEQAFAENRQFDLILLTGDLAQDPCLAGYRRILAKLEDYNTPCICLPGNHDDLDLMRQVFNNELINCRKQYLLGNWQIIALNSQIPGQAGGRLDAEELTFLESCLMSHPNRHAMIAVHHHCLETGSTWMDTMLIENSRELWTLVKRYPQIRAITTGHIHQIMDVTVRNVRVLGVPSTCFQFLPKSTEFKVSEESAGYRIFELTGSGQVVTEAVRLNERLTGLQTDTDGY